MDKVCTLGFGYIGLPTASILATHGFDVIGVDINARVVEAIAQGSSHIGLPYLLAAPDARSLFELLRHPLDDDLNLGRALQHLPPQGEPVPSLSLRITIQVQRS